MRGAWRLAARSLVELAARVGDWPVIWHNIAVLRGWLADTPGTVEALHKYAAQDIPLDDAVEAEALAQLLDTDHVERVDVLTIPYGIGDFEPLLARLAANARSLPMPIDLARMGSEEEPPPKGAYWLLDRGVPESGQQITLDEIPRMVGQAFLFGKQTDRAARLELVAYRTELTQARQVVSEVGGDALGPAGAEEITTQVPAVQHVLSWNWRLPDDTPPDHRLALMNQHRREILLNAWPEMPQRIFNGKPARDAARDPAHRIKLLGAILLLELSTDQLTSDFDFNELRAKLALPAIHAIDPKGVSLGDLPLVRLGRVAAKQLSDEALVDLYRRADHYRHISALRKSAHEVIARPSLDKPQDQAAGSGKASAGKASPEKDSPDKDHVDKAEVYGILAQIEPDTLQAIAYLEKARQVAEASKTSTAPWDLAELTLRIARGEVPEADRLLHHIRDQHIREPGVAQALFQILTEAGIIGPDGKPTAAAQREAPGIVVPGAAAAEPGKIWTPGSDQPSGKKSALWTPGME